MSRNALEEDEDEDDPFAPVDEDEDDDPFATRNEDSEGSEEESEELGNTDVDLDIDEDEEIDSDEALGESDVERFKNLKFRGSKKNQNQAATYEEDELSGAASDDDDENGSDEESTETSDIDIGDDDEEEEGDEEDEQDTASSVSSAASPPPSRHKKSTRTADREALSRAAFDSASTAGLAATLAASADADVKKGQAVKQQRQTFDRILDARIKLQKGIAAVNELPDRDETISDEEIKTAARKAEDAALALWSTIDSIRCSVLSLQQQQQQQSSSSRPADLKRKLPLKATRSTPVSEIWTHTKSLDSQTHPYHRSVLDKWHAKTQPPIPSATSRRSNLLPTSSSSTPSRLTDVLDTYLLTSASTSTAPSSNTTLSLPSDAQFYQSLLRDLISSRSSTTVTSSSLSTSTSTLPIKLHGKSNRAGLDTKASKGRKIRYTVHEKLENFMAPEDRTTWTDEAKSEFFGSLLGGAGVLREEGDDDEDDEEVQGDGEGEGDGLRLF